MRYIFWLFVLLVAPARATTSAYSLLDLGPILGPYNTDVFLNDLGQTVFTKPDGAFRYTDGTGGAVIAKGWAGGINNAGQVSLLTTIDRTTFVARYTDGRGIERLAEPSGYTQLTGPNSRGEIAFGDESGAFYISDQGTQLVGNLTWPYSDYAYANDINDSGMVVYGCVSIYAEGQSWVYAHPGGFPSTRPLTWVSGLNNRGDLIGFTANREASVRWADGTLTRLGTLNGYGTVGVDLNDTGTIIGIGQSGASGVAWVMTPEGPADLNTLIDSALGWRLTWANSINNAGQIAGTGFVNGQRHAFRLTPTAASVPEPGSLALLSMGAVSLLMFQAKRRQASS